MGKTPSISICIPTLGRPESLNACIESIKANSFKDYEIILIEEEGELAQLRNRGAEKAKGEILTFIDDDVIVSSGWLKAIHDSFRRPDIVGVSGAAIVRGAYRSQRDLFRFGWAKWFYDLLFLEGRASRVGRITKAGTWTTGATEENCDYEGSVDYLEACNMSFRRVAFEQVGGFDECYGGIGDWSEPDLCYRIKTLGKLWFSREAKLFHNCARTGAFHKRKRTGRRLTNYWLFASRWVKPHWRHTLFKWFLITYYWLKDRGIIQ